MEKSLYFERVAAGPIAYEISVVEDEYGERSLSITQCAPAHSNHEPQTVILTEKFLGSFHQTFHRALEEFELIPRAYCSVAKNREAAPRANMPWASWEDAKLADLYSGGIGVREVADVLQRTRGGILFRLMELGFIPK